MISNIPKVFIELLASRGVIGKHAISKFLFPQLEDLPRPGAMKNLSRAADTILSCLQQEMVIVVWGDYDVDGTTGTSLLVNFFKEYGIEVEWHIPNRFTEGYGLNMDWFYQNRSRLGRNFLVITIDCGISEKNNIASIKGFGGTVIVTDHHSIPDEGVPDCIVVNPSQSDCGFHDETLAGVGVVFYLAVMLRAKFKECGESKFSNIAINLKQFLPFVALGTIADVVPLGRANRILVRAGLEAMADCVFPGIRALLESCDIFSEMTTEDIGFLLGPKINAAGRLGNGELVVNLFIERNIRSAQHYAKTLTSLNYERKAICEDNLALALELLESINRRDDSVIVLAGDFHLGVAGIVAARLAEQLKKPVIILGNKTDRDDNIFLSGSARSVAGINIVQCLSECTEYLLKFGGHSMAAGLTMLPAHLENFQKDLWQAVTSQMENSAEQTVINGPEVQVAAERLMSPQYLEFIKLLEPFGPGNEMPVFCDPKATIIDARRVGRNAEHLQIFFRGQYVNFKGIGFSLGGRISAVQENRQRKILFAPTINRYRGTTSWQLRVIDLL